MGVLFAILLFFHVLVGVLLVLIILMQRPKQEGLGAAFGAGMMNDSFGAQTTDVLQKATRTLAIAFFILSISLAVIKAQESRALRVIRQQPEAAATVPVEQGEAPQPGTDTAKETPPAMPADQPKEETGKQDTQPAGTKPASAAEKSSPTGSQGAAVPGKEGAKATVPPDAVTPAPAPKPSTSSPGPAPKSGAATPAPAPKPDSAGTPKAPAKATDKSSTPPETKTGPESGSGR